MDGRGCGKGVVTGREECVVSSEMQSVERVGMGDSFISQLL